MKLFQVTIPNDKHREIVSMLQDELELENVTSIETRSSSIVTFRVEDVEMQSILRDLQRMGVGVEYGICDVMSLTPGTSINTKVDVDKKRRRAGRLLQKSAEAGTALPVAEMFASIESRATLSRDSLGMLLISSTIAGIGLAGDSPTYLVASMLLSPLMGPIVGCSFGFAIKDRNLFITGLMNEVLALLITLILGVLLGILLSPYAGSLKWPTNEMRSRGQWLQLVFGGAIACLSGTAVGLAESNANISSVVGTAIAAALLPPTVNCGICLAYYHFGAYFSEEKDHLDASEKMVFLEIAVGSALLVMVNVIFIYGFAVIVFKCKKVGEYQLVHRVDEDAWKNLPRVQNTPTNRKNRPRQRFGNTTRAYSQEKEPLSPSRSQPEARRRNPMNRISSSDSLDGESGDFI